MRRRTTPSQFDENTHEESNSEFHRRVQDSMDKDSWIGRDEVGQSFPKPGATVHEYPKHDSDQHIWREKK